jgi:hypothetical protein
MVILILVFISVDNRIQPYPFLNPFEIEGPFPFSPWYQVLPALALALFLGPFEEFGWHGLALPRRDIHKLTLG